jgi:hypothetical protein
MKTVFLNGWILICAWSLFSCGKIERAGQRAKSESEPGREAVPLVSPNPWAEAGTLLRPWIAESRKGDPTIPADEDQAFARGEAVRAAGALGGAGPVQGKIHFDKVVPWPLDLTHQLYLVWNQNALGPSIDDAYFEFEKVNVLNEQTHVRERQAARLDRERGQWFIPLKEIIGERPDWINPSTTHIVRLELHRRGGEVATVEIDFRLLGPLPQLTINQTWHPTGLAQTPQEFMREAQEGLALLDEKWTNPTSRPLRLWIKPISGPLSLRSFLTHLVFSTPDNSHNESFESHSQMHITGIRMQKSSNQPGEFVPVLRDNWVYFDVGAFETINIRWIARLAPDATRCSVPPAQEKVFRWTTMKERCRFGHGAEGPDCDKYPVQHEARRMEPWEFRFTVLRGDLSRQVVLSDPSLHSPFSDNQNGELDLRLAQKISDGAGEVVVVAGPGGSGAQDPEFNCAGVFL